MAHPTFAETIRYVVLIIIGLLFSAGLSGCAADNKKTKTYQPANMQTVGIINPDGGKTVMIVPDDLSEVLDGYSWQQMEGVRFYHFASWKDAANFLTVVNERLEHIVRAHAADVQELSKRVETLKRARTTAGNRSVNRRIEALEKKVKEMSDGGNL